MKTIEEKAKAYDEIIERAKTMLAAGEVMYGKENNASQLITDIIPELKESEDERMMGRIIDGFKNFSRSASKWNNISVEEVIAWLEKQKESLHISESCKENADSFTNEDERIRKYLIEKLKVAKSVGELKFAIPQPTREECISYLERQKEQKPNVEICPHSIKSKSYRDNGVPTEPISDELVDIIKGVFEGFRRLLKKKGIDYEPQYGYWEGFARLFDSSAREYVKGQKEQKPERINVTEMVAKYRATDEYDDDGHYKGKPINCMIRAYEKGIRDTLSKVKEQNPAWSEEDTLMLTATIQTLERFGGRGTTGMQIDWLKSLSERFNLQPKQEWSEEDADILNCCISSIEEAKENRYAYKETDGDTSYDEEIVWLKSLRPQPHWKPSEEQMAALFYAEGSMRANNYKENAKILAELYVELKKL